MTPAELGSAVEALFDDVARDWAGEHRAEVRAWLDRVEYPMALDTLSGVLQEERYPLTPAQRDVLKALATAAGCDPRVADVDWLVTR